MSWSQEQPPKYSSPQSGGQRREPGQSYQYERLNYDDDEIRLLQVNFEPEISYELVSHVSLRKSKPRYIALSYTWGDQTEQETIIVNGIRTLVSSNLCRALEEVTTFWRATYAENSKRLTLWVDQVCINQANNNEKNHQVALMRMIYDRAEEVLIWLPIPPQVSSFSPANGMPEGYKFGQPGHADWNTYKPWLTRNLSIPCGNEGYQRPSPLVYQKATDSYQDDKIKAWTDICAILQSPWWRRAWVHQEFVFATRATFLVGGYSVPWQELHEILSESMSNFEAHATFWKGVREDMEDDVTKWNSKVDQSRDKSARALENQADDGDCCIYCGESCASLNVYSHKWLKRNNRLVSRFFQGTRICFKEELDDKNKAPNQAETMAIGLMFLLWFVLLVLMCIYFLISGLVAGSCYVISNRKWNCNHQRQSVLEQESAQQELQDLERDFAKAWTDPAASRQAIDLHCERLAEANEAWELAKFFFSSKTDIATAFLPLSQLVQLSRNTDCTDPRDHIFAFLSLTDVSYDLQASYGNSVRKVLIEAVSAIIMVEKNMDILTLAFQDRDLRNDDWRSLPSWVPWLCKPDDKASEYNRFLRDVNFPLELCKASKDQACVVSFQSERGDDCNDILKARGIRIDTLTSVIEDPPRQQVWCQFGGQSKYQFITRQTARPGDEIWVLLGLDMPVALSRPSKRDDFYTIVGPVLIQEEGQMSDIMTSSLIDKLEQGEVYTEDICIL